MILTITMNPSIDFLYNLDHLELGRVNKVSTPTCNIGGKGINAGRAAALMGSDIILTGFLFGNNGYLIEKMLTDENIFQLDFIKSKSQNNRNALTIMHDNSTHTEIVESGPYIDRNQHKNIINKIDSILLNTVSINTICISGSVNTHNIYFYQEMMLFINKKFPDKKILLDISGTQLVNVLKNRDAAPFFIKPNIHEFSELIGKELTNKNEISNELEKNLLLNNIPVVLVSCGSDGAVVKNNNEIYDITIPKIKVVNPTGAGDSTVGGFAYSLENNYSIEDCLRYAMACGISNTKHNDVGYILKEDVLTLTKEIIINKI